MSNQPAKINLLLASGNAHKAEEFAALLDKSLFVISAAPEKLEVDESGDDYYQNAFLKAKSYFDRFKCPLFSDDSGLTIEALPRELGVHSARFGGEGLTDQQRAQLAIDRLDQLPQDQQLERRAFFSAVLCFYLGPQEHFYFEGRVDGVIANQLLGEGGFGYDPIFIPRKMDGQQSFAQNPQWKQQNSHRAVAAQAASHFFANR
ncbi:MAG: non-canonical purine NTP pyrophosphatase [Bdellovibrionales bacterium]|nr:non-canonical purine NTP pyrophosphatase [Bdellovibrionales bacterium]MBT3525688.1 non-canonical purine NTP pyrophosphatase [Bdellovibrionales bacterium]MBT7767682.1 non-canonical purine NTP pyrophosphatase [Bdellovibrionales bacterium]